jgi:lipopolysaccharide export system permease protein
MWRGSVALGIFDRYVLWRVIGVMLATIATGILLLCMARMLVFMQSGARFAQEFPQLATLTVLFIPHYLGFMLPFALFWGSYVVVRRLSLNSELQPLFASGMSFFRFNMPLLLLGVVVTLINFGLLGWFEPLARYTYREIRFNFESIPPYFAVRDGVFMHIGRQTVLVESIDAESRTFSKVFLFEQQEDGGSTQITADRGEAVTHGKHVTLVLRDGIRSVFEAGPAPYLGRKDFPELYKFELLAVPLTSQLLKFRDMGEDEQELSLVDLYAKAKSPPIGTLESEMTSELNRKLVIILSSLFLPLLATLCAQANTRGRNVVQGVVSFGFMLMYQQLIQVGSLLTDKSGLSPLVTMWPVFGLMVAGTLLLVFVQDRRAGRPTERIAAAWFSFRQEFLAWYSPKPRRGEQTRVSEGRPMSR